MLVGQHLFGLKALQQATTDKGAQDASAQGGLHLGCGSFVDGTGRLEDHVRRCRLGISVIISVIISVARHGLKHAVDHADMEMHMLVQAGAKVVNEAMDFMRAYPAESLEAVGASR